MAQFLEYERRNNPVLLSLATTSSTGGGEAFYRIAKWIIDNEATLLVPHSPKLEGVQMTAEFVGTHAVIFDTHTQSNGVRRFVTLSGVGGMIDGKGEKICATSSPSSAFGVTATDTATERLRQILKDDSRYSSKAGGGISLVLRRTTLPIEADGRGTLINVILTSEPLTYANCAWGAAAAAAAATVSGDMRKSSSGGGGTGVANGGSGGGTDVLTPPNRSRSGSVNSNSSDTTVGSSSSGGGGGGGGSSTGKWISNFVRRKGDDDSAASTTTATTTTSTSTSTATATGDGAAAGVSGGGDSSLSDSLLKSKLDLRSLFGGGGGGDGGSSTAVPTVTVTPGDDGGGGGDDAATVSSGPLGGDEDKVVIGGAVVGGGGGSGGGVVTPTPSFFAKLKLPKAQDVLKRMKLFVKEFAERADSGNLPSERRPHVVRVFSDRLLLLIERHPVWKGATHDELDAVAEGIEKYVTSKLYSYLFRAKSTKQHKENSRLWKTINSFNWIKAEHLDIDAKVVIDAKLTLAKDELCKMNNYKTPRDKLVCILNCCKVIYKLITTARRPAGADEFLPLLIFTLIRSNPPALYTNMEYIMNYRNQAKMMTEPGYYYTQLQSAISFVEMLTVDRLTVTADEWNRHMDPRNTPSTADQLLEGWLGDEAGAASTATDNSPTEEEIDVGIEFFDDPLLPLLTDTDFAASNPHYRFANRAASELKISELPLLLSAYKHLVLDNHRLRQQLAAGGAVAAAASTSSAAGAAATATAIAASAATSPAAAADSLMMLNADALLTPSASSPTSVAASSTSSTSRTSRITGDLFGDLDTVGGSTTTAASSAGGGSSLI